MIVLSAALAGCSGGGSGPADRPVTRATLAVTDHETFSRCPPLSVARLRGADIAFSGTLSIEGPDGVDWVLAVDRWYTGGDEDVVVVHGSNVSIGYFASTVTSGDRPGELGEPLRDGDRLLVAGPGLTRRVELSEQNTGYASACLTEEWTPELDEMFAEAFPSPSPRPVPGRTRQATPR